MGLFISKFKELNLALAIAAEGPADCIFSIIFDTLNLTNAKS
jgi:hypothetical protein